MAKRVLVTDHVFGGLGIEHDKLDPLDVELVLAPAADEETLVGLAAGVDGILVCFAQLTAPVIEAAAGSCKIISRYGIGIDNIDIAKATDLGIQVTNVPDYCLDEVADHTLALLLASGRGVVRGAAGVAEGDWEIPHGAVHRIRGRRLALLGVGRIGRRVVQRALPLGLDVIGHDPFLRDEVPGMKLAGSLEEAVAEADYISLHAPLTEETHHLVDAALIGAMNRSPHLINTSRGPLVDADAVLAALESGELSGVALDVTEEEPLPEGHPLRTHPAAVITPHMAFYSVEAEAELQSRAADEVVAALNGEMPRCPINEVA
jgi:D-3-phosphoglycerate dehydrogenase